MMFFPETARIPRVKEFLACTAGLLVLMAAAPAGAGDPYAKPDDSWISLSGTVRSPEADLFRLEYGNGKLITVEMDDWDSYGDTFGLVDGDHVVVYGRVDDGLFESAKIEAGSVYVEGLNTYFYASSADEEGDAYVPYYWTISTPVVIDLATLRGTVTGVNPEKNEFTVDTGPQSVVVETGTLGYDPFDDDGYQKIEKGDRVSVTGALTQGLLEGRRLTADAIITLADESAS